MKNKDAVALYRALDKIKFNKLPVKDTIVLAKAYNSLKGIATKYDENIQKLGEKLKPDGFDDLQGKMNEMEGMTIDESNRDVVVNYRKMTYVFAKKMDALRRGVLNKETGEYEPYVADDGTVFVPFDEEESGFEPTKISDDGINKLVESNPEADLQVIGDIIKHFSN